MKKISAVLVLFSVLAVMVLPLAVSAQQGPLECCKIRRSIAVEGTSAPADSVVGAGTGSCELGPVTVTTEKWGIFCLINTLNSIVDWIFVILVSLAVLFTILGAINLLMSAGDPGKVTSGRNYIMYAAIGLVVAFIARAIPALVKAIMGF